VKKIGAEPRVRAGGRSAEGSQGAISIAMLFGVELRSRLIGNAPLGLFLRASAQADAQPKARKVRF